MTFRAPLALLATALLTTTAFAAPNVVASIKPVHSLVAAVMAGVGEPTLIVKGSASPHTYALRPSDAGALESADLGPSDPDLPCAAALSAPRITTAFTRAVLASPARWANVEDPSKRVSAILIDHVAELPSSAKQVIAKRADDLAKKALVVGIPGLLPRAVRLCQLKDALGIRSGSYCAGALISTTR